MAVCCKMEILAVRRGAGLECGRCDVGVGCAKPQQQRVIVRSMSSQKRWQCGAVSARRVSAQRICANLRLRCNAIFAGGENAEPVHKDYDINVVLEKVIHDEENELSSERQDPDSAPESGSSPFPPAGENTDGPFAEEEGDGLSKDRLTEAAPPNPTKPASSSIGDGLGASEQSALAAEPVPSRGKRDWRVHASNEGLDAVLENEGGNSVDDYKLRAHIFEESDVFFKALKEIKESHSVV